MSIETLIDPCVEFYWKNLGDERVAECLDFALATVTPQLASELGEYYTTILYKTFLHYLENSYKAKKYIEGE